MALTDLTLEEQQNIARNRSIFENAVTVSNIVELATSVVSRIAGKDIADSIDKESLSRNVLSNLVANRIKEKILTQE